MAENKKHDEPMDHEAQQMVDAIFKSLPGIESITFADEDGGNATTITPEDGTTAESDVLAEAAKVVDETVLTAADLRRQSRSAARDALFLTVGRKGLTADEKRHLMASAYAKLVEATKAMEAAIEAFDKDHK